MVSCKIKKEDVFNSKIAATVMYGLSFFQLGLVLSSLGPIFKDLVEQTSTEMSSLSFVFPARSVAYLIGSALGGPLFDRFDGNKILVVALSTTGIGTLSIPFANSLWLLSICVSVQGLAMGFLDTGGNLMLMYIHGDKVSPYLQGIHLAFGVGALVSPLFVELSRSITDSYYWAFWGMSVTFFITSILFLFVKKIEKRIPSSHCPKKMTKFHWPLIGIGALFLFLYVGCEISTGGYLFTYAVDRMEFTESEGDFVNALFWGALTVGRLGAIPVSVYLSSGKMLIINFVGSIIALTIMLVFSHSQIAFWIGVGIYGLCMASTYPCVMSLVEESITLTGKTASLLVVGGAFGEMVIPFSVATIFTTEEPLWEAFLGVQLASAGVSLILLFLFFFLDHQKKKLGERSFLELNIAKKGDDEDKENSAVIMTQFEENDQKIESVNENQEERDEDENEVDEHEDQRTKMILKKGKKKGFNYNQLENENDEDEDEKNENENDDDDLDDLDEDLSSTERLRLKE